jgi:hypothetical protein
MIEAENQDEELYDRIDPEEIAELTNVRDEGEEENQESNVQEPDPVVQEEDGVPEELQEHEEVPEQEEHDDDPEKEPEEESKRTRSGRAIVKPTRYIEQEHVILHQTDKNSKDYIEYRHDIAIVAATTIEFSSMKYPRKGGIHPTVYPTKRNQKIWRKEKMAAIEELDQLHKEELS